VQAQYKGQLETMLQQFVAPCFSSPYGHLRAKACWVAGNYTSIDWANKALYGQLLQAVMACLNDADLPVQGEPLGAVWCGLVQGAPKGRGLVPSCCCQPLPIQGLQAAARKPRTRLRLPLAPHADAQAASSCAAPLRARSGRGGCAAQLH
jgi:hypothetical protein